MIEHDPPMSNSTRHAERQPTNTAAPMPVDAARDILAIVRGLEARVAVLEAREPGPAYPAYIPPLSAAEAHASMTARALTVALSYPTVPDTFGRV